MRPEPGGYCADPKKFQATRCFRRFLEAPLACSVACSGPKLIQKGCQKEVSKRFPREPVFTMFQPRRSTPRSHFLVLFWGTKAGSRRRSTERSLRSRPLEALVLLGAGMMLRRGVGVERGKGGEAQNVVLAGGQPEGDGRTQLTRLLTPRGRQIFSFKRIGKRLYCDWTKP